MKIRSILLSLMAIAIVGMSSCKKDDDDDDDDNNTPTTVKMLSKSVANFAGMATTETTYHYTSGTTKIDYMMMKMDGAVNTVNKYTWDNDKVIKIEQYSDEAMTSLISAQHLDYNGNEVDKQYTIDPITSDTVSVANYEYTNGKLTKAIQMDAGMKTITEYSWTGDNIAQMKTFEVASGGQLNMTMQTDILYDAMTNPMKAMNLPSNNAEANSANNPIAMTLTDGSGSNAGSASLTYVYDGTLPLSYEMTLMIMGMPMTSTTTYEYTEITVQ